MSDPITCRHAWFHFHRRWECYDCGCPMTLINNGPSRFPTCIFDEEWRPMPSLPSPNQLGFPFTREALPAVSDPVEPQ